MTVRVVPGQTDLATLRPEIAAQWDTERNAQSASEFTLHSQFRAWWLCARNHSFQSKVAARTGKEGTGCPFCGRSRAVPGETDLATKYPDIADQWHPNKNSNEPSEVSAFSAKKAWWICEGTRVGSDHLKPHIRRGRVPVLQRTPTHPRCQ